MHNTTLTTCPPMPNHSLRCARLPWSTTLSSAVTAHTAMCCAISLWFRSLSQLLLPQHHVPQPLAGQAV